jgi:hypothetical protein
MMTTIYLATACGLAVIQGGDENWVGEVCLNDSRCSALPLTRLEKELFTAGHLAMECLEATTRERRGMDCRISLSRR